MTSRRAFLRNGAVAMFGIGAAPAWLARAADQPGRRKVLVAVFQRGAVDGLNVIVPHADQYYYALRPSIAIAQNDVLDLDGFHGLHPSMEPLKALYDEGRLAVVNGTGSPDPTRSHFDAQDYMESGTPGRKSTPDGWLNRALTASGQPAPVRAVAMGPSLPRSLRGGQPAIAVADLAAFQVKDGDRAQTFETAYLASGDKRLVAAGRDTFEAVRILQSIATGNRQSPRELGYPNGRFGQNMAQIARLVKADAGLEVAFADMGGWDTHVNQPAQLDRLLRDFARTLAAFSKDLGDRMEDVVVVTMSEFGRTARENGNRGTDHGHANFMLALGGGVRGGKVYGRWPGLEREQLYEGRDLAVTTDFRDVLGELTTKHLGVDSRKVFPGHMSTARLDLMPARRV